MANVIDMTGLRFGKLIVKERDFSRPKGGKVYWICQCDCGNTKSIVGTDLRNGKTRSCGCGIAERAKQKKIDLTNMRFGRLVAIKDSGKRSNEKVVWECVCDCGNLVYVTSTHLTSGATQSCGCLQKERTGQAKAKDLTNQRFGHVVALRPTQKRIAGQVVWECKCDCGAIFYTSTCNLTQGKTHSCGCMKMSQGAEKIAHLLQEHNISYVNEKVFLDCVFEDTGKHARFDFWVNNEYIIEFDGVQHFKPTSGWNTIEKHLSVVEHDKIKNNWCKQHNIPIIRIPYTQEDNLCIEDLLLETTTFLVK